MLRELAVILLCIWLAVRLRRHLAKEGQDGDAWDLAKKSLRLGTLIVTVPLLGFFGVERYIHGAGFPALFSFLVCSGITALVFIGTGVEFTGNILIDATIVSAGFTFACFTVVNGLPGVMARATGGSLCCWCLACIGAGLVVRAFLWALEGD